ncbi:MAG: hypothetical protein HY650_06590 [Acidobacteria bacterium]|nr:hypothetical protein [Acidobacteriota bacterium]
MPYLRREKRGVDRRRDSAGTIGDGVGGCVAPPCGQGSWRPQVRSWPANGDQTALEKLMPLVYDELRRMARRYMSR